jgi:hypothetical protein
MNRPFSKNKKGSYPKMQWAFNVQINFTHTENRKSSWLLVFLPRR